MIISLLLLILTLIGIVFGFSCFNAFCRERYNYNVLSIWNILLGVIALVSIAAAAAVTTPEAPCLAILGATLLIGQWVNLWRRTSFTSACVALIEIFLASAMIILVVVVITLVASEARGTKYR